jgi:hypothetical protein
MGSNFAICRGITSLEDSQMHVHMPHSCEVLTERAWVSQTACQAGSAVVALQSPLIRTTYGCEADTWHNLMLNFFGFDQHVSPLYIGLFVWLHCIQWLFSFSVGSFRIIPALFFCNFFYLDETSHARCQREEIGICRDVTATYRTEYLFIYILILSIFNG